MICGLSDYRRYTGDMTSVDGDVTDALTDAQNEWERMTNRFFENAVRTETVRLYANGRIYPKAFPITNAGTVGPGAFVDGASVIVGYGYQYAEGINPFVSGIGADSVNWQPQITVTYTGGYTADIMPVQVKRAVAVIAYNGLHANSLAGVPVGANSVRLGDLSVSGRELSGLNNISDYVAKAARRWRRPSVEAFN